MVQEKESSWTTETGLPNDIDAWIRNPRFGMKDEYLQAVQATGAEGGLMFLVDLEDESGEVVATQGWSVGTGWIASDDGAEISHPTRKNVVGSSMYGQLQNRVVKELAVDMDKYGLPTQAKSWNGLGFHWMQELHKTVSGADKTSLMPTEFLGEKEFKPKAKAKAPAKGSAESKLTTLAQSMDVKAFQKAALKLPEVVSNDDLMASVLEEGPAGFWATHQEG